MMTDIDRRRTIAMLKAQREEIEAHVPQTFSAAGEWFIALRKLDSEIRKEEAGLRWETAEVANG